MIIVQYLFFIAIGAVAFFLPSRFKSHLRLLHGIMAAVFVAFVLLVDESTVLVVTFLIIWILGSLSASIKKQQEDIENAIEQALDSHRFNYHGAEQKGLKK